MGRRFIAFTSYRLLLTTYTLTAVQVYNAIHEPEHNLPTGTNHQLLLTNYTLPRSTPITYNLPLTFTFYLLPTTRSCEAPPLATGTDYWLLTYSITAPLLLTTPLAAMRLSI